MRAAVNMLVGFNIKSHRGTAGLATLGAAVGTGLLLSIGACSSSPPAVMAPPAAVQPFAGVGSIAPAATAGTTATPAQGTGTGATAGTVALPVAGTVAVLPSGPSAGAAGTSSAGAAGTAAAGTSAAAGSGAGAAGTMAAAGSGSAGSGGTITLPAPDEMGPYEVKLDQPVGMGFGVPIASSDVGDGVAGCMGFATGFGADPAQTAALVKLEPDLKMDLYSLYRPATLEPGKKYPVITWGNGTCAKPEGYGTLLRHWASHGFFVIAANSRQVGQNSPMTKALDWAVAANKDEASPYFGHFDLEKIGASGHSQGGGAAIAAARDARIKTVIIFNGGSSATKPWFSFSGDRDLMAESSLKSGVTGATLKAAYIFYHMVPGTGLADGHLTLMVEPKRVVGPSTAWFRMMLLPEDALKPWFVGADCQLCNKKDQFEYAQKNLN